MKKRILNMYNLHNKTIKWCRYERKQCIAKYFQKSSRVTQTQKRLISFKKWDEVKLKSISCQTNVCKNSGAFKKTLNCLGFNRHMARQHMNCGLIPAVRKLSW